MGKKGWIDFEKSFRDFEDAELNKPGTIIEAKIDVFDTETDKEVVKFLIGHVNKIGGVCDDCTAVDSDDKIIRYKVLVSEDEIQNS